MCGIFGLLSLNSLSINQRDLFSLSLHSENRGLDSSGFITYVNNTYNIYRSNHSSTKLLRRISSKNSIFTCGHSRLMTNSVKDNQPIINDNISVIHNGIIVNDDDLFSSYNFERHYNVDSEILISLAQEFLSKNGKIEDLSNFIFQNCIGTVSCLLIFKNLGKGLLLSNNGSLYIGSTKNYFAFSSESYPLQRLNCSTVSQLNNSYHLFDIPISKNAFNEVQISSPHVNDNFLPTISNTISEKLLKYRSHDLKRCKKCILPETMPFITFNSEGICNYCTSYRTRNKPKPTSEFTTLLEKYTHNNTKIPCIFPFSGGRDSCWGLHLAVKEFNLKPITYTYDWGMITDLGRRNISRMCSSLNVENIIVAADLTKKRKNIERNVRAWLKSPHLGMVSLFTAGDKHFFRHVNNVRQQTGISLNIWSINPLEVTHFKSGFLGIKPDFIEDKVYTSNISKQLLYQFYRLKRYIKNPSYINSSLFDTLSGEYWRSVSSKTDYHHLFDYVQWNESECNSILDLYDWERAVDTPCTWRIGDATAPFYNYIYYTVAGFTEHDTFRSNQIREGEITREKALELVKLENLPRYPNLKWYLDSINLDFDDTINAINNIPSFY